MIHLALLTSSNTTRARLWRLNEEWEKLWARDYSHTKIIYSQAKMYPFQTPLVVKELLLLLIVTVDQALTTFAFPPI